MVIDDFIFYRKEAKKLKQQENRKRQFAKMKANALLREQMMLQQQRKIAYTPTSTPIIKDGVVVGYAVKVSPNAVKLPTITPLPTDGSWPELEDWSLLEPDIVLEVKNTILKFNENIKPAAMQQGARQVMVNGKLLTLVPYQQNNVPVQIQPKLPKSVTIVKEIEVSCDLCGVKLPPNLLPMHMKMRHGNNNETSTATDEIQIDDEDPVVSEPSKKPMPELIELNPDVVDENQDPLQDPLAI